MILKIDIWDRHEIQVFTEEEKYSAPHPTDSDWHKWTVGIEFDRVRIDYWQEYVLFDKELTPEPCVKIYLSDGKTLFGRYKTYRSFEKIYDEFLKSLPRTLVDIVKDLEG
jgi:hypothetical protein